MTVPEDLLNLRFYLNMNRITGLVELIHSLKPSGFQSEGVRADILRAITVFLPRRPNVLLHSPAAIDEDDI